MYRKLLIATGALALAIPSVAAYAAPADPAGRFDKAPTAGRIDARLTPKSASKDATVQAIVEVKGDPVAVVEAKEGRRLSNSERNSVKSKLRATQDKVAKTVKGKGGKVQAQMQSAYNGIRVSLPRKSLDAVAALPDVVAVHAVRVYTIDNAESVPYIGIPAVWQNTGYTGEGVKVAIIDTGIDYTHANFGGPGTVAAYDAAHAAETSPADPSLFGPNAPRVKGGWDFAGDDYDADPDSATYQPVPHPDPNPLDCNGHGSHVAGTAGGNGVTADGATYTGPYDASTPSRDFRIGPGVAPKVDLYALRVFGCSGSTDVTTEAIDWAVDHDMDVINMSLGSVWGTVDDPTSVAATHAIGAGGVVVSSAGNSGPNPYLAGSPGVANGVVSVSAVDSIASFPGADLAFSTGATLKAMKANNADLPSGPLSVVLLKDDPATEENEALGCSVAAFEKAGVTSGGKQLAVATRGTCARVAKAIFGQQAGAAAVLQLNTDDGYPPFEGDITSNPDDGTPYVVTIPFLGVPNTAAETLQAADGGTVTLTAAELANPGYRAYGSFSSGGPTNVDSSVSPLVAAPGVSIVSTGVGTGNEPATISGTSMAAPHVAGVAALAVQAHPTWDAQEIASALVTTADPEKVVGQNPVIGGVGLIDPAQVVSTTVLAAGDIYRTDYGKRYEPSLSFGFSEPSRYYVKTKEVIVENLGKKPVTYKVAAQPSEQSQPAKVTFSTKSVTVKPGKTATFKVTLWADASKLGVTAEGFLQVSGDVVLTSGDSTLRVPYLLVPRAQAKVRALGHGFDLYSYKYEAPKSTTVGKTNPSSKGKLVKSPVTSTTINLTNAGSVVPASADFYTWGLADRNDIDDVGTAAGLDLRAVGVQSFAMGDDQFMVFAINNYTRWSTASSKEFDVEIDTNGDGDADYVVWSADYGLVTAGDPDGQVGTFVTNLATGAASTEFFAQAPTDSSTILLPVYASSLGLTAEKGGFTYTVASYDLIGTAGDTISTRASYNPWSKAVEDGQFVELAAGQRKASVTAAIDPAVWATQKPLGLMSVVFDNKAGADEALLLAGK